MSPVTDGRVYVDKDGFLRDERGLKSMPHLTALISAIIGVYLIMLGTAYGFIHQVEGWIHLLQIGAALLGGGTVLEGYQTTVESRNQNHGGST